jgi:hypothetical protein
VDYLFNINRMSLNQLVFINIVFDGFNIYIYFSNFSFGLGDFRFFLIFPGSFVEDVFFFFRNSLYGSMLLLC